VLEGLDGHAARLLDRQGEELPMPPAVSDLDIDGTPVVAVDLPLTALAAGEYVLELTATSGATSEQKLLAFRVVP
jgi:hypothetical protein